MPGVVSGNDYPAALAVEAASCSNADFMPKLPRGTMAGVRAECLASAGKLCATCAVCPQLALGGAACAAHSLRSHDRNQQNLRSFCELGLPLRAARLAAFLLYLPAC